MYRRPWKDREKNRCGMAASCNHVGVIRSGGGCRYGMAPIELVIEKRIPCGGCREEDSPIRYWKEGFKRKWK